MEVEKAKQIIDPYSRLADEFFENPDIDEMLIHFKEPIPLKEDDFLKFLKILRTDRMIQMNRIKFYEVISEDYYYKEKEHVLVKMSITYIKKDPSIVRIRYVRLARVDTLL